MRASEFLVLAGFLSTVGAPRQTKCPNKRPHIIYILADDMGWNDVSFHGSDQIPTPNLDSIGINGVILNRHYVQPLCTPSRATLMTGRYPIHTGLHDALGPSTRVGLNMSEKILPQYLKELGYTTHLVGKWHLGYYKKKYTPLERGFDSHFGYWSGAVSYYDHIDEDPLPPVNRSFSGHDMRRNSVSAWDVAGEYATDLFTKEAVQVIENHPADKPMFMYMAHLATHAGNQGKWLEAPQEEINKFSYISDPNRRTYAAMVSKLDQSVGEVLHALQKKKMLCNSIIVFVSDNGAPNNGLYNNWGSNYPWRGEKATLWEGAVRTPAVVWSPLIKKPSRVSNELMHISDWLPTLLGAAGYKSTPKNIDGENQWPTISQGLPSPRQGLVVDINDVQEMYSIIMNGYKYIKGPSSKKEPIHDTYLNLNTIVSPRAPKYKVERIVKSLAWQALEKYSQDPDLRFKIGGIRENATIVCDQSLNSKLDCTSEPCVFDLEADPCEQNNLANSLPDILNSLQEQVEVYKSSAVPVIKYISDPAANPNFFNDSWSIWEV